MIILLILFIFSSAILLLGFGILKQVYLEDRFKKIITEKFKSLGFSVLSIKNIDKPHFLKENDFDDAFYSGKIVITSFRAVTVNINEEVKSIIVSLNRTGQSNISIDCYIDFEGIGVYKKIE